MTIPKTVWMFWLQGFDQVAPLVQTCVSSWRENNPDWTVQLLSADNIRDYLDPSLCDTLLASSLPYKKIANIFRVALIARHGGVWADADCFCAKPLDQWIHEAAPSGFFAFRFIEGDRWYLNGEKTLLERFISKSDDRLMANWFLAGEPGNHICTEFWPAHLRLLETAIAARKNSHKAVRKKVVNELRRNAYLSSLMASEVFVTKVGKYPHYVFHYHFARFLRHDPVFRAIWEEVKPYSAKEALVYSKFLGLPVDDSFKNDVRGGGMPVYKFHTRRTAPLQEHKQTRYEWLQENFGR